MEKELQELRETKAKYDADMAKAAEDAAKDQFKAEVMDSVRLKLEAEDKQKAVIEEQAKLIKQLQKGTGVPSAQSSTGTGKPGAPDGNEEDEVAPTEVASPGEETENELAAHNQKLTALQQELVFTLVPQLRTRDISTWYKTQASVRTLPKGVPQGILRKCKVTVNRTPQCDALVEHLAQKLGIK